MVSLTASKVFAIFTMIASIGISTTVLSSGALSNNKTIQSSGSVTTVNVGVYWNSACTNATTTINWGSIAPGSSKSYTVYVRNEGSVSETLSLSTQGWNPSSASTYISLTWNKEGAITTPNSVTTAVLTLSISSSITGITTYSFNIIVTGSQ